MLTATVRADAAPAGLVDRLGTAAMRPVSSASTSVYRVLLGVLVAFSAARFVGKGWVEQLYLAPEHHVTYTWFPWVRPLPPLLMYATVLAMVPLGLAIAIGYRTRLAALCLLVVFAYCELIDAATYLNHYWYLTLAIALAVVLPLDNRPTVPAVVVWLLRAQLAVVYVMAGLAKLNHDWLVRGEPMSTWLASRTDVPVIGPLLDEPWAGRAASWAGVLFDLTIVGWLLWRRTRVVAYLAVIVFHVLTWRLFAIGVFPWVMLAGTLVFFPPDWPDRISARSSTPPVADLARTRSPRWVVAGLAAWAVLQVAIPLRHLAYPGDVRWTEEGYYGSFRVMLTEKTGWLRFEVHDPVTGETWTLEPSAVLTDWQERQAVARADLTLATAHLVATEMAREGHPDVEVRADSFVSFNGRPRQRMIDPSVDLAALSRRAPAAAYVLPLDPPTTD